MREEMHQDCAPQLLCCNESMPSTGDDSDMANRVHTPVSSDTDNVKDFINLEADGLYTDPDGLEPIAVIGMAIRGPQHVTSPDILWDVLAQAKSLRTETPLSRFSVDALSQSSKSSGRPHNVPGGHFLGQDLGAFDAPFFGMSPEEASCTDPQQRLLLEVTYEALENAGVPLHTSMGTKTSAHIGCFNQDYGFLLGHDPQMKAPHKASGNSLSMLANRLSWFYDWSGPSITIDTACSSSLISVHLACQALRNRESDAGIAGGCNIILNPDVVSSLGNLGFLSPDGLCKSFDAEANGYSRGEGFGIVVLKRLADAVRDGDMIRAVIRGTGTNQDAKTPSITQPSSSQQEILIRDTYRAAGLTLNATRFFEAHGTGTSVGDPLEAKAIQETFKNELEDHELYVGAVKSNLGHLEGASGITGLIKSILVLEKGIIPPNVWPKNPNPKIPRKMNLRFPDECLSWPTIGLRRASVNSFGFGGSNAHCILDDAYHYLNLRGITANHNTAVPDPNQAQNLRLTRALSSTKPERRPGSCPQLLIWSAPDEMSLQRLTSAYDHVISSASEGVESDYLHRLAYTLSERRSSFRWKSFLVYSAGNQSANSMGFRPSAPVRSLVDPKLCYMFSGQGTQSSQMGCELRAYPIYAQSLEYSEKFYRGLGANWSLNEELDKSSNDDNLRRPELSQPFCTALQLALVDLLHNWGLTPHVVVGHSSGEIAAAFASGAISRDSALKIAYFRGVISTSIQHTSPKPQAMMSANLSKEDAQKYIERLGVGRRSVAVACLNTSQNVTLSGDSDTLDVLKVTLEQEGIFCRKLKVDVAYHSSYMRDSAYMYNLLMGKISPGDANCRGVMISSVTGQPIADHELRETSYWARNLVEQVNFCGAIEFLTKSGSASFPSNVNRSSELQVDHFIEIGPHPVLRKAVLDTYRQISPGSTPGYSTVLSRGTSSLVTAVQAAAELYCIGSPVSINAVNQYSRGRRTSFLVDLPTYPFDHSRLYWKESRRSYETRYPKQLYHELLGSPVADFNPLEPCWRNSFDLADVPWIAEHNVQGAVVVPAVCMLAIAMEAARQHLTLGDDISAYMFKDVSITKAIVIPAETGRVEWQTTLRTNLSGLDRKVSWGYFVIYVYDGGSWVQSCRGSIGVQRKRTDHNPATPYHVATCTQTVFDEASTRCTNELQHESLYESFRAFGYRYGPSFQGIKDVTVSSTSPEAVATVDLNHWQAHVQENPSTPYCLHPTVLDALLQTTLAVSFLAGSKPIPPILPNQIDELWISNEIVPHSGQHAASTYSSLNSHSLRGAQYTVNVVDKRSGAPLLAISVQGVFVQTQDRSDPGRDAIQLKPYFNSVWQPEPSLLNGSVSENIFNLSPADEDVARKCATIECMVSLACQQFRHLSVSPEALSRCPHLSQYSEWMQAASQRHAVSTISHVCHESLDALMKKAEGFGAVGQLTVRGIKAIPDIFTGDVDPLELIFRDDLVNAYYAEAPYSKRCYAHIARYVDLLAHKNPSLRILELGAGTGGCTGPVLEVLRQHQSDGRQIARFSEYNFTDISPSFFEQARARFSRDQHNIQFTVLDIEKDPALQNVNLDTYDVVIASNVIHATHSVQKSLANARKLLKSDGCLILYELVRPDVLTTGLVFGLLPGWWLSAESCNKLGPLLTENLWKEKLQGAGFSGPRLSLPDFTDEATHLSTVMIADAVSSAQCALESLSCTVFIVIQETAAQWTTAKNLQSVLLTQMALSCQIVTLDECLTSPQDVSQDIHVIMLAELEGSLLLDLDEDHFERVKTLVSRSKIMIWPTTKGPRSCGSPAASVATGILRSVQREHTDLRTAMIVLESDSFVDKKIDCILHSYRRMLVDPVQDLECEYEQRKGVLGISRLKEDDSVNESVSRILSPTRLETVKLGDGSRRLKLTVGTPGLLDTLHFTECLKMSVPLADDELEIKVVCAGLNFKDLLTALGVLDRDFLGIEAAGIVTRTGRSSVFKPGQRVLCVARGCFGHYVRCKSSQAIRLPANADFATGAALPVIYGTAYYSLVHKARIEPGETVLIHSAAGGLGQALIQVAQLKGAEIFATVGSEDKRQFLTRTYGIPPTRVFFNKDCDFADQIKLATAGRGVDVVINSLSGEKLRASWECVAPYGRFIEVGKRDMELFQQLPMKGFARNGSFFGVDFLHLAMNNHKLCHELLDTVVNLFEAGEITVPAGLRLYPASQVEDAFRYMQSGKALGKAVFELGTGHEVRATQDRSPKYHLDPTATYLIAGGLGGLGQSAAQWMVQRGARYLILLSRRNPAAYTNAEKVFLDGLRAAGVKVAVPACDVADYPRLRAALSVCAETMPPIKGCLQSSMILRDGRFDTMKLADFNAVLRPKVQGSWNLHLLLPRDMEFFILLSSISGIIGQLGQSNYGAGNTYQDALANYRVSIGQKAISLDLGVLEKVGYVADRVGMSYDNHLLSSSLGVSESEFHAMLEVYCDPNHTISDENTAQLISGINPYRFCDEEIADTMHGYLERPMFRYLHRIHASQSAKPTSTTRAVDYTSLLREADSIDKAGAIICDAVAQKLSQSLGMDVQNIEVGKPLHAYGVDSLGAIELRKWFARAIGADVSVIDILKNGSIAELSMEVSVKSGFVRIRSGGNEV